MICAGKWAKQAAQPAILPGITYFAALLLIMLRLSYIGWIFVSCYFCALHCGAQSPFRFEQALLIDRSKGLPENNVRGICKDPDGFVWIGTSGGLCRFDGTRIKTYCHAPEDSSSLLDNEIYEVVAYRGRIWVATAMGLSVLDPRSEQFVHFQFDSTGVVSHPVRAPRREVTALHLDTHGILWIGAGSFGVARYLPEQNDFQFYPVLDPAARQLSVSVEGALRILSMADDLRNDSILYAGTPSGLEIINLYSGQVQWCVFRRADPATQTAVNAFRRLYFHDDGLLYAGSWHGGVQIYDPKARTLTPLPVTDPEMKTFLSSGIQSIFRYNRDQIWITTGDGLILYDLRRNAMVFSRKNDVLDGFYYGIDFIDERNRVWNSNINGIHIFDPVLQQFVSYEYEGLDQRRWSFAFYMDANPESGELVVVPRNNNSVCHFNLKTGQWRRFPLRLPGDKTPANWLLRGLSRAPDGTYTLSADQGLFSYDPARHTVHPLNCRLPLQNPRYTNVLWDRAQTLWIGVGLNGLARWNPRTKSVRVFEREFLPPGAGPKVLVTDGLMEDRRGQIWIRRSDGFSVYLPEHDSMLNFLFRLAPERSFFSINGFAEDRQGHMWVCGKDGWVGYAETAHPERGLVRKIDLRADYGLSEVYALAADSAGLVWGYTREHLIWIDPQTLQVGTLNFEYCNQAVDFYAFQFLPDGRLVFGGRSKIVLFDPRTLQRNSEAPKPYVEAIQVLGRPLSAVPQVNGRPGLHLKFWENNFSLAFSAKAFTLGYACRFRYRLKGLENWIEADDRRYANYTNVPAGDYLFQVQVANNEGQWSESVLELPVGVDTAWWATTWFRLLAGLLALSMVYGVYRYRILQIRRQERLRSGFEKRLANVEMSALLAQMNPHFLFNSLNSIDSYIIRNETKKASEYLNNFARLMRLILNNSRSNYISLKDELEALDLYLQMESLRFRDKFEYEIRVDPSVDAASITIPPMLIQPYIENAIWHGLMHRDQPGGKVMLAMRLEDNTLICSVEDNGIGRARAMELNSKRQGANRQSMGMQITEDRIEVLNKLYDANTHVEVIDLYDPNGEACGTRVVLTIPI